MKSDGFLSTIGLALCLALTAQIHARSQLDHTFQHFQRGKPLNVTSTTIGTTAHNPSHPTVALQAAKYPNITIGQAWVYPSSPFDLGARAMSCECFAPTDACCMSNTVQQPSSQFCMPSNSTCCGNTFCPPKSTCCGDFCCDLGTSCVTSPTAGCCPLGKTCLSTVKCYDHSSNQCTGKIKSPYCCSEEAPFCRTEQSQGLACYASPKVSASTATPISHTDVGSSPQFAPQTTAPLTDTTDAMASPIPPGSLIFATLDNGVVGASSPASSSPTLLSQQSAAAPTSSPASPAQPSSSSSSSIPPPHQAETSDTRATPTTTTTRGAAAAAAAKPARCYDEAVGSAKPCPTIINSPTTASTSAAAAAAANSTVPASSSAGTHIHLPPFSFSVLRENVKVIGTTVAVTVGVVAALVYMLVDFDVVDDEENEEEEEEEEQQTSGGGGSGGCECQTLRDDDGPILVVPGTGRRLSEASRLGREIRRVEGSARVLGEGVWVDKGDW